METGTHPQPEPEPARNRWRLGAVVGIVLINLVIWAIAVLFLGVELQATSGPGSTELEAVPLGAVVLMSLCTSLAGWGLLAVLERLIRPARTAWTVIALSVLIISYGGPLLGTGIPTGSRITLALMHTAVAALLIPVLRRTSPTVAGR